MSVLGQVVADCIETRGPHSVMVGLIQLESGIDKKTVRRQAVKLNMTTRQYLFHVGFDYAKSRPHRYPITALLAIATDMRDTGRLPALSAIVQIAVNEDIATQ